MPLSVRRIAAAKAGRHSDGGGLYLLVQPSGSKSWVLRVQQGGRRHDYGLGSAVLEPVGVDIPVFKRKSLTLAQAREKARIGRELVRAGINPSVHWRVEDDSTPSFEEATREFHKQISKGWRNGKHGDQWITTLKTYAFPIIGALPVDKIEARTIQKVLTPIWLTKGETARRVRQRIGAVLDYAHGKGWRDAEAPMRALNQLLGGMKQPGGTNFASMPYKELPAFWAQLQAADFAIGRAALQFLILTAARSGEIRKARWRDIDPEVAEWKIPRENAKTDKQHIVPLVPAAMAILEHTKRLIGGDSDELIFPGLNGPMSDGTLAKMLRAHGGAKYTVHGFRSTFRDWAAEGGFADTWAEAALAHTNPNRTESAYRRTTFFDQRRNTLMPAWEKFVMSEATTRT